MSKKLKDKIDYALSRGCTRQEEEILNYLYEHANEIPNLTAKLIAEECICSTSAVNRAIKKIDLEGYTELKNFEKFNQDIEGQTQSSNQRFNHFINQILDEVNYDDVEKMAKIIKGANKISVYGNGVSNVSSLFLFRQLLNLEYNAVYIPDLDLLPKIKDGIILTVSNTGTNNIVNELIEKQVSVPVYGITKKDSPLDSCLEFAINHNINLTYANDLEREQQIQILLLIDILIDNLWQ